MKEFLSMGGYAEFLWPAFGVTFFAVLVNIWMARRVHRQALEEARRRIAVEASEGEQR